MEAFPRFTRHEIATRIAGDIADGSYVNLGIGIPTLVADHIPDGKEIVFHSENGMLGFGRAPSPDEIDPNVINAGKEFVTIVPGSCFMGHADSFALIRGGHLDLAILGAYQVSSRGDLANWATDGEVVPAVGGAMDLAAGARQVWVAMSHTTPKGKPKLVSTCTYPLTARHVVTRVYTDLAVLSVSTDSASFEVIDIIEGLTLRDLESVTDARLEMASA